MNKHCDSIVGQKNLDASGQLVGHVEQEIECKLESVEGLGEALFQATNALYTNFLAQANQKNDNPNQLQVHNAWFVRSFATDYNPVHIHTSGQFSCILFLKIPSSIGKTNWKHRKEPYATEGWTDFLFGSTNLCSVGSFRVQPKVGDFYVFPAYLSHTVYPFFGEGERRSFSANLSLSKAISKNAPSGDD
tara:strand:+ start:159 stop:728 length:570 start_codon:yes stop_codon:yes gene_type:complete